MPNRSFENWSCAPSGGGSTRLTIGTAAALWLAVALMVGQDLHAADGEREGDWIVERDEHTGRLVQTMELTLHPRPEPRPALKHRLIEFPFDRVEGNAALYYLKAMGFLEQQPAQRRVSEFKREAVEKASAEGKATDEVPPYSWLTTPPSQLPKEQVREYLRWLAFQPPFMEEAARRRTFDLDRRIRDVDDPVGYLLPEIQAMRELARTQSIRCRLAIAENDMQNAVGILGQQYALAGHLGQDVFLISNLVGASLTGIAFTDALYLLQHSEAPNLYWAFASLPDPLVDMRFAFSLERDMLLEQLKVLRQVDETPRPAGYWQSFVDQLLPQLESVGIDHGFGRIEASPEAAKAALVAAIGAAYPGAKQFLIEQGDLDRQTIEQYPTAQVVFLATRRFHEQAADNLFKWNHLPYWQTQRSGQRERAQQSVERDALRVGWAALPTRLFLSGVQAAAATAQQRSEQYIALLQTVEAIRAHGAGHAGELPSSLSELALPAPLDPLSGEPFSYERSGERAILRGSPLPGHQYRLILRFAQNP